MAYITKVFTTAGESIQGRLHRIGTDQRLGFGDYVVLRCSDGKLYQIFLKAKLKPLLRKAIHEHGYTDFTVNIIFTGMLDGRTKDFALHVSE